MDDTLYGVHNQRGEWSPSRRVEYAPLIVWPPRPAALLRWLLGYPGYVLPFNLLYALVSMAAWFVATPSRATMSSFGFGWIALLLVRNAVVLIAWYRLASSSRCRLRSFSRSSSLVRASSQSSRVPMFGVFMVASRGMQRAARSARRQRVP